MHANDIVQFSFYGLFFIIPLHDPLSCLLIYLFILIPISDFWEYSNTKIHYEVKMHLKWRQVIWNMYRPTTKWKLYYILSFPIGFYLILYITYCSTALYTITIQIYSITKKIRYQSCIFALTIIMNKSSENNITASFHPWNAVSFSE